jgi:hypothetical protein
MPIAVTNIGTNTGKTVASLAVTVGAGGVPAGALIVIGVSSARTTSPTSAGITDTAGNTYSGASTNAIDWKIIGTSSGTYFICYCPNAAALVSGNTITYTPLASATCASSAFYATGVAASSPFDTGVIASSTSGGSASPSSGNITPAANGELIVGFVATNGPSGDTFTQDSADASYATPPTRAGTSGASATSNWTIAGGSVVQSTAASIAYAPTITSRTWACGIAAFAPGSSAISVSVAESGAASDAPSATAAFVSSDSESGSATDTPSAATAFSSSVAETGSALDSSAVILPVTTSESGSASDTPSVAAAFIAADSESGAASDAPSAIAHFSVAVAEAGSAADAPNAGALFAVADSEAGSAADAASAAMRFSVSDSESGAASDAPSGAAHFSVARAEAGSAVDTAAVVSGNVFSVAIAEAGSAVDHTDFQGFVLHYTGVLVPKSTIVAANCNDYTQFNKFVAAPFSTCDYTTKAIDTGIDDTLRVFESVTATLGPSQTGTPTLGLAIDTWLTGASDPEAFTPWTIGYIHMRYLRERLIYSGIAEGGVAFITQFTPEIDKAPQSETADSVTVGAGGTTVTFPEPFHFPPFVTATAISNAALTVTVVNVTATQMDLHVWNSAGVDVGGTVNYTALGE